MPISTNGAIITRVTSALYGEYLSNASYKEISDAGTAPATLATSFLSNDFAGKTDLQIANTMLTNLGLTSIAGLNNWLSAQLTAAGSTAAAKGAKIVSILNDYANMTSDATYGTYATSFNSKVAAGLVKSQTVGNAGGSYATADAVSATNATYTLTTGIDTPVGGAGDDSVLGTIDSVTVATNTFSVADVINGGAGTDTLQVTVSNITGATTITPTQVTGIESVRVINVDPTPDAFTVDLTAVTGVTSVEASTSSGAVTYSNIADASVALKAIANTAAVSFNVKTTALTGTADAVNLSLTSNNGSVTVNTNGAGFEAANISVAGTNAPASLIGAGADIKTATITGAGSLTIDAASLTAVKTLDASKNTGGVSYTATATNTTLTGGDGNDTLAGAAGNDVISGGAGNDAITAGAGNDSVDGGAGNDTVTLTAVTKDDSVQGGDGTDTLSIGAAIAYTASTATDDSVNIKGFETLTTTAAITQNMLGLNANNTIATFRVGAAGTTVLQNVAGLTTVTGSTAGNVTVGLKTNGTADSLAVTVGDATNSVGRAVGLNATQIETLTVNAVGGTGNTLTLGLTNAGDGVTAATDSTATSLKSLTITGSKSLTVTGSGADTALATVNAADFTGATLSVTGTGSTTAMTVTATGAYDATITTGTGADNIAGGSGNDVLSGGTGADTISGGAGNDTISGSTGANVMTGGAGNDTITGSTDADNADGGEGDDSISVSDGANTVVGGAGNDTITTGTGADSVSGGDGNDSITTSSGNDTVDAGEGADTIDVGAGNDSVTAGGGNDTITGGTGDDTISAGDGNDTITITSLTNGDSIDGGAGNDRLTISSIASDATPSGISGIEDFRVTSVGGGATSITADLTKVTGITALVTTLAQNDGTTLTLKNLPSTLATISVADGASTTDNLAISYGSGPSSLAFNAFANTSSTTNITSLNAPLTINGKLTTDIAGEAQVFSTQKSSLGNMTTDATSITVTTDALPAAIANTELTIGNITDSVIQSLTISGVTNSDITLGTLDTSSAELAVVSVTAGQSATTKLGAVTANSATTLAITANSGAQGTLDLGNVSATSAAVTVSMTLGDQASIAGGADTIKGKSIGSSTFTVGAGTGVSGTPEELPTLEVGAVTGTIGNITISTGVSSFVSQIIGSTTKAATIGTITATGSGNASVTLNPANTATVSTTGASTIGAISASTMTSPLSSLTLVAGDTITSKLTITGGAGNDTLAGGVLGDTITGGTGVDSLTGNSGQDTFVFSVGDSNAVLSGAAGTSNGQDLVTANGTSTAEQLLRFNITSADTTWNISHIQVGTADGAGAAVETTAVADTVTIGDTDSYTAATVLVQAGVAVAASADSTDAFDIAVRMGTALTAAQAQAMSVINLTGTVGADTLSTGDNNDTISGGAGNDNITGNLGGDVIDGGSGNDTYVYVIGNADSRLADTATSATGMDSVTFATGDIFSFTGVTTAVGAAGVTTVTLAAGTEATGANLTAAIATAITEAASSGFLIKVVDSSTDSSFNGNLSGYYLAVCADGTFSDNDTLIKVVGLADTSTLAVGTNSFVITA